MQTHLHAHIHTRRHTCTVFLVQVFLLISFYINSKNGTPKAGTPMLCENGYIIYGDGSKARTPSEHPNPTTKTGSKMGGEFTYQPKWDTIGFDPQPYIYIYCIHIYIYIHIHMSLHWSPGLRCESPASGATAVGLRHSACPGRVRHDARKSGRARGESHTGRAHSGSLAWFWLDGSMRRNW